MGNERRTRLSPEQRRAQLIALGVAFLADRLDVRKADITIRSGRTSRLKLLHLAGDSAALMAKLARLRG